MYEFFGNSPSNYLTFASVFIAVVLIGVFTTKFFSKKLIKISKKTDNKIDDMLSVLIQTLNLKFYIILGVFIGIFTGLQVSEVVSKSLVIALSIFIGSVVLKIVFSAIDFFTSLYFEKLKKGKKELITLIPALRVILKLISSLLVILLVLSNVGVDVTALIAGFGIGGLAVAFAFQKILADIFSTFVIFLDKPFSVGDFIKVNSIIGTVERVGLKTTSLRAVTGERVVIANENLANAVIWNKSDRPTRLVGCEIPIAYTSTPKQLNKVREVLLNSINHMKGASMYAVQIKSLSEHAILFEFSYELANASFADEVQIRHDMYVEVLQRLKENNISLGYPIVVLGSKTL